MSPYLQLTVPAQEDLNGSQNRNLALPRVFAGESLERASLMGLAASFEPWSPGLLRQQRDAIKALRPGQGHHHRGLSGVGNNVS